MLYRVDSFYNWLGISEEERIKVESLVVNTAIVANNMVHLSDYHALSSILLHKKPKKIFEIGTYLGVTSDFFLQILPECEVVSIAYPRPFLGFLWKKYNNTDLSKKAIGSQINGTRLHRYKQIYGDSQKLVPKNFIDTYGRFDLVFVDGDHSLDGVRRDTEFAMKIINESGAICWHDANPKEKYQGVKIFLEQSLKLDAIATKDDYQGGIAYWNKEFEKRLKR